jgi:phage-related protein
MKMRLDTSLSVNGLKSLIQTKGGWVILEDIATVEYGWPIGMPTCRPLGQGIWEVRSTLPSQKIARVLFGIVEGHMVLLHGFIKKAQKTPDRDLQLARKRLQEIDA